MMRICDIWSTSSKLSLHVLVEVVCVEQREQGGSETLVAGLCRAIIGLWSSQNISAPPPETRSRPDPTLNPPFYRSSDDYPVPVTFWDEKLSHRSFCLPLWCRLTVTLFWKQTYCYQYTVLKARTTWTTTVAPLAQLHRVILAQSLIVVV